MQTLNSIIHETERSHSSTEGILVLNRTLSGANVAATTIQQYDESGRLRKVTQTEGENPVLVSTH